MNINLTEAQIHAYTRQKIQFVSTGPSGLVWIILYAVNIISSVIFILWLVSILLFHFTSYEMTILFFSFFSRKWIGHGSQEKNADSHSRLDWILHAATAFWSLFRGPSFGRITEQNITLSLSLSQNFSCYAWSNMPRTSGPIFYHLILG